MTTLQKELSNIIDSMLFPSMYTSGHKNSGSTYPPYNIIRLSETEAVIEIAVAGFKEEEVSVVVEDGRLKISGKKTSPEYSEYLYKGIGTRAFEKSFALSKDSKVTNAEYADGILSVFVSYETAPEKKPKQIPISRGEREYLTEQPDDIV